MANTFASFDKRLRQIDRKNRKLARGYRNKIMPNGLIQPKAVRRFHFPLKGFLLLVAGFFIFKAFMLASVGPVTYEDRLAVLGEGTAVEQGGAWMMQVDPVTAYIARFMGVVG
ncbi:hypothetical protein [Pseudaestuariivita atlantica]|uniref:Uncharacterized protein n=1 Tax=Pseudaestuariivita atlantica TaxID=1317121 RepID=A0A0L1JSU2_9RHOB|nr:hypothetical protein [Pseudaestuariivita atlantica]KNG94777.1 hypothetical protein ATO11_05140 [Pseudaestuariivita atlantica]